MVQRLLTPHPYFDWPEAGSAALQGGGATGSGCLPACGSTCGGAPSRDQDLCCVLEATSLLNWWRRSELDSRLRDPHPVQVAGSWIICGLNLWYLWRLCVRMYSITRSGPLPLSPILRWLIIIAITHWNWIKLRLRCWRSQT